MEILILYFFLVFYMYIVYSVKPTDFVPAFGQFLKWMLFPIIFIITVIFGFIFRKDLRWLKPKWFLITCKQFWKIMVNNEIQKMILKK